MSDFVRIGNTYVNKSHIDSIILDYCERSKEYQLCVRTRNNNSCAYYKTELERFNKLNELMNPSNRNQIFK